MHPHDPPAGVFGGVPETEVKQLLEVMEVENCLLFAKQLARFHITSDLVPMDLLEDIPDLALHI